MRGKFFRVTDCFALFGLPRRPALAAESLKEKYLQLAATSHPDSGSGDDEKFRTVQEAYQTLLDSAARLRHLLALEFGAWEKKSLPAHQDLFLKVGGSLQQAKAFQQRLEKTGNYRQLTNNYKRGTPDSCSEPLHEMTLSYYDVKPLP